MATIVSTNGIFEVTSVSFTPKVVAFGDEISYEFKIKNKSGKKISSMYITIQLAFKDESGASRKSNAVYVYGGPDFEFKSVSWSSGSTKTFSGKFTPKSFYKPTKESRLLDCSIMLDITTNVIFSDDFGNSDQIYGLNGSNGENLKVFDSRYVPSIASFALERSSGNAPDDEGENALATIRLGLQDATYYQRMALQLRYRDEDVGGEYATIDLSSHIHSALQGDVVILVDSIFGKQVDYEMILWFGDEFESRERSVSLGRSFANVHLSGAENGGVRFGGFSKATDNDPLFECSYPAEFENGIKGGFTYQLGEVDTGGRWIDGRRIYRRVFMFKNVTTGSGAVTTTLGEIENFSEIDAVIEINGMIRAANELFPLTRFYSTSAFFGAYINNGAIRIRSESSTSLLDWVIVQISYTKSTEEVS